MTSSLPRQNDFFLREVEWCYTRRDEASLIAYAQTRAPSDIYELLQLSLAEPDRWAESILSTRILRQFTDQKPHEANTRERQEAVTQWLDEVAQNQPAHLRYALAVHLCHTSLFRHWAPILVSSLDPSERLALLKVPHLWPDTVEEAAQFEPLYAMLDAGQRRDLASKVFTDSGRASGSGLLEVSLARVRQWGHEPTDEEWTKVLFDTFLHKHPWMGRLVDEHPELVGATALRYVKAEEPALGDQFAFFYANDHDLETLQMAMKTANTLATEANPMADDAEFQFPLTSQRLLALQRATSSERARPEGSTGGRRLRARS